MYKSVKNYSQYQVNELGEVKCFGRKGEYLLKPYKHRNKGYLYVRLKNDEGIWITNLVHRIVAETFIPNPDNKPTVDHINGDKTDNRLCNLRWATYKEQANFNNHINKYNEERKAIERAYYLRNRDKIVEKQKEYYQKHKDYLRELAKEYYHKHKKQ